MKAGMRGLVLVAMALLATACSSTPDEARRVLIVTIDTLRWDRLGYAGHDVETPNIDALAESGTIFERAVTVAPITLPAHSSLFTGLDPPKHGVRTNGIFRLPDDVDTAAEAFREAGFATGAFVGAFVLDRRYGLDQGFDHYDDDLPESNPLHTVYVAERPATEVVDRATRWIRERGDETFFAWVHVFEPHAPYVPPAPFAERYASRPYDGEVAFTDHALAPLFDLVGGMDDALIVVTADHGESLGEHGESTHGLFIYDSTTRVPLVMSGAGIPAGRRYEPRVRITDVAPTVLELAGLTPPDGIDGESLLPALAAPEPEDRSAYSETFLPRYSFHWSELRSLRRGSLKLIQAPRPELYDLRADPKEQNDLWETERKGEAVTISAELVRIAGDERAPPAALELDPETVRSLESLGYITSGGDAAAADDASRADPKDRIEVYEHMQALLSPDLPTEDVLAGYREILDAEPTNAMARNRLGNTLSELGRFDEAVEQYRVLVQDEEIDDQGLENLAAALLLSGRTEEALLTTEFAVASAPWNPDFHVMHGEALEQVGRLTEALDAYSAAAERDRNAEHEWRLGAVHEKLNRTEAAEAAYRRSLAIDEAFEPATAALARLLAQDGRPEEAYALLAAVGPSEGSPAIAAATAEAHIAAGLTAEAKAVLERARVESPEDTRVLAMLGAIYAQEGNAGAATRTLETALELGETTPDVLRNLAILRLREGNVSVAVSLLERAREQVPDSPSVLYSLGNAYFRAGERAAAAEAFERALELRSPWPEAAFNLGMAAESVGDREGAARAFRSFLETSDPADGARREEAEKRLRRLTSER